MNFSLSNKSASSSKFDDDSAFNVVADWGTCSKACGCGTQTK